MRNGWWARIASVLFISSISILPMGAADGQAREGYCGDLVVAGQGSFQCKTEPPIVLNEQGAAGEKLWIQAVSYPPLAQLGLYDIAGVLRKGGAPQTSFGWPCDSSPIGGTSGGSCAFSWPAGSTRVPAGSYDVFATYQGAPQGAETWAWGVMACLGTSSSCLAAPHVQGWCRELLEMAGDPDPASRCGPAP